MINLLISNGKYYIYKVFSKITSVQFVITICFIITFVITWFATWEVTKSSTISVQIIQPVMEVTKLSYSLDTLPNWDFTRLINIENFKFSKLNTMCDESEPFDILVMVHSAPNNTERRNAIRETWGQPKKGLRTLFLLGEVNNQIIQNNLDAEDEKYHDLIQGNFIDHYKNMTYKHIMAFKYTVYYCPSVKYLLKTDDDTFVNIYVVMNYMQKLPKRRKKNLILCYINVKAIVRRGWSKWSVMFAEYPRKYYPTYCSGFAIFYSYDVVLKLYKESQKGEYCWIDDVYITGILARKIKVPHTSIPDQAMMTHEEFGTFINSGGWKGRTDFWYGPVNLVHEKVRLLWSALMNRTQ